ncbi:MAG: hypothetical protein J0653_00160, partial [Deltaproteobacteria bacterium]|nr:hypothetical protein [Deltaproteobacteria bacterium]
MNVTRRFSGSPIVWLGLGFLVFLLSVAIPIVGPLGGVAGVGIALGLLFFLLLYLRVETNRNWFFWFMLVLPLVLGMPRKLTGISLYGFWQLGLLGLA